MPVPVEIAGADLFAEGFRLRAEQHHAPGPRPRGRSERRSRGFDRFLFSHRLARGDQASRKDERSVVGDGLEVDRQRGGGRVPVVRIGGEAAFAPRFPGPAGSGSGWRSGEGPPFGGGRAARSGYRPASGPSEGLSSGFEPRASKGPSPASRGRPDGRSHPLPFAQGVEVLRGHVGERPAQIGGRDSVEGLAREPG